MISHFILIIISWLILTLPALAAIYKYVDKNGQTWYSNQMPEQYKETAVQMKPHGEMNPQLQGRSGSTKSAGFQREPFKKGSVLQPKENQKVYSQKAFKKKGS